MNKVNAAKIESLISKNLVFKAKDLEKILGKRSLISFLLKNNMIHSLGSGFYTSPRLSSFQSTVLLSKRYFPKAILSGTSALRLHGLIDFEPTRVEADIPKSTSQRNHLIEFTRVAPGRLIEIQTVEFMGAQVQVYGPERALADCLLKKVDRKIFAKALATYISRRSIDSDRISALDKALGTNLRKRVDDYLLENVYTLDKKKAAPPPADPGPAEKDRMIGAAILTYARVGAAGLDFRLVADEAGVSVNEVASYFHTKTRLKEMILEALKARILETGAKPLPAECYTRQWLHENITAFIAMSEMDEIGYRIQRWCMAEQNMLTKEILKLCSQLIRGVAHVVVAEVPGIDYKVAEARALTLVTMLDSFASIKWYYSDLLEMRSNKNEVVENYKRLIWDRLEDVLFGKP